MVLQDFVWVAIVKVESKAHRCYCKHPYPPIMKAFRGGF